MEAVFPGYDLIFEKIREKEFPLTLEYEFSSWVTIVVLSIFFF